MQIGIITEEDYLNALRDDWKSEADPFDECNHYVDVSKYDNFEDYEKAVNICLEHLEWIEEVSRYGDFDIDPQNYKNEDTYLDALAKRIKEKYDPENEFYCIDPLDYDSPYEYFYEKLLFCKWVVIIRLFTMFRAHYIAISHSFWRQNCHFYKF